MGSLMHGLLMHGLVNAGLVLLAVVHAGEEAIAEPGHPQAASAHDPHQVERLTERVELRGDLRARTQCTYTQERPCVPIADALALCTCRSMPSCWCGDTCGCVECYRDSCRPEPAVQPGARCVCLDLGVRGEVEGYALLA